MTSNKFTIAIMGAQGTGKTAITMHYVLGFFMEKYEPTIEDLYNKKINIDGENYKLNILDTGGVSTFFDANKYDYINEHYVFVVVFNPCMLKTFEYAKELYYDIDELKDNDYTLILVSNNNNALCGIPRIVSFYETRNFAIENRVTYIDIDAKNRYETHEIFNMACREHRQKMNVTKKIKEKAKEKGKRKGKGKVREKTKEKAEENERKKRMRVGVFMCVLT